VSTSVKIDKIVCYLQLIMNNCFKYFYKIFAIYGVMLGALSCTTESNNTFSEIVKVSLRDVGHHLLLNNQDSTSLVKPIVILSEFKYQLSFEKQLTIHPDSLVAYVKKSFLKADLPTYYLVEVLECQGKEVAYSYQMKKNVENGIIPCGGRQLHKGCYLVNVKFSKVPKQLSSITPLFYFLIIGVLAIIIFLFYKLKRTTKLEDKAADYAFIGKYKFYPEQNKLIKEAIEISLSKKECELLSIFVAKPNQIIKRDELTKKVWEDNGVIVGRSLDTYISKLRKILKDDTSIKLINVHGIGYKLEVH